MKKVISILTLVLLLTAMFNISVARHYCGGDLVAVKISLSGTLATCGMEGDEGDCPYSQEGDMVESHCCDDVIASLNIGSSYIPASKPESGFSVVISPAPVNTPESTVISSYSRFLALSGISPPGQLMTSSVYLPDIMVFRI